MRTSCTAYLVLATALIFRVAAGPVKHVHAHFHEKKEAELLHVEADIEQRDPDYGNVDWKTVIYTISLSSTSTPAPTHSSTTTSPAATTTPASSGSTSGSSGSSSSHASKGLTTSDASRLATIGFSATGINAVSSSGGVWFGSDGPYTNTFTNAASEPIILVIWGPDGSWVNARQPLITQTLPPGSSVTVSFAEGSSGAFSAIYPDTVLSNGQISNTWGEHTFSPEGVADVSREPDMNGHNIEIVGPHCTTNMNTCVFVCSSGNSCMTGYELLNCAAGSQPGAQYGTYGGAASGGCGWLGETNVHLQTTFS